MLKSRYQARDTRDEHVTNGNLGTNNMMIIHYGYEDGSGRYYVSIDADMCDACNDCIAQCPQKIIKIDTVMIDIDDKEVAVVDDSYRRKIKDTCGACHKQHEIHCIRACTKGAIATTWEQKHP
jgi:ferredoxin